MCHRRCGVAGGRPTEEGGGIIAGNDNVEEGGHIIAGTTTTMDTDSATIAVGMTPQGGEGGDGVIGRAIEGVRRLWPAISVVDVSHRCGRQLVGHRCGHLSYRHRPSLTSAIVAAVDEWDMWWGAYGKKGRHKSNH